MKNLLILMEWGPQRRGGYSCLLFPDGSFGLHDLIAGSQPYPDFKKTYAEHPAKGTVQKVLMHLFLSIVALIVKMGIILAVNLLNGIN